MGNNRCTILSIHRYYENEFDRSKLDLFNEQLVRDLRNVISEDICNFIIVECDGGKSLYVNKFIHIGITRGLFKCYAIEIRQPIQVCLQFNRNKRSLADIASTIEDLDKYPPPARTTLLDPTSLLLEINHSSQLSMIQNNRIKIHEMTSNLSQLLNDRKVMDLVKSSMSMQLKTSSNECVSISTEKVKFDQPPPPHDDILPVFTPVKIIDHQHAHLPTFEETLMEFKVHRVFDYTHKANSKLRDFVKDIDTERIAEKLKSITQRKKILQYLKQAERPEDTVSNPKYPNNWEVIQQDRPPLKNKRKKKLTAKIIRVLAAKEGESRLTTEYVQDDNQLDYEDISSDDLEDDDL